MQAVVAGTTGKRVVTGLAVQRGVGRQIGTVESIVSGRAVGQFNGGGSQVNGNAFRSDHVQAVRASAAINDRVVGVGVNVVGTVAAAKFIRARMAVKTVRTIAARDHVVAVIAMQAVVAGTTGKRVVPVPAIQAVISALSRDGIVGVGPAQGVVGVVTIQRIGHQRIDNKLEGGCGSRFTPGGFFGDGLDGKRVCPFSPVGNREAQPREVTMRQGPGAICVVGSGRKHGSRRKA